MKIFVTGATGFIGSHFLNEAHAVGHELHCIRRPQSQPRIPINQEPYWHTGSLEDDWSEILSQCSVLVHFASAGVSPQKATMGDLIKYNIEYPTKLFERAAGQGIKKFLITGSSAEYGRTGEKFNFIPTSASLEPVTHYSASKAAFFQIACGLAATKHLKMVYARLFTIFGEGQFEENLWPSLKKAAFAGDDFQLTLGEQIRDFTPVTMAAKQIVKFLEFESVIEGEIKICHIGTGKPQTLREFAEYWWDVWGGTGILRFGADPYRENEVMRFVPKI